MRSAIAGAAIHLHLDWSGLAPTAALTPLDSLLGGSYTVLHRSAPDRHGQSSEAIDAAVLLRSYATTASGVAETCEHCLEMLARQAAYQAQALAMNPETRRFEQVNDSLNAACHKPLEEALA